MKLIFSPDDHAKHGKGYYWQEYKKWRTSQLFKTEKEAIRASDQYTIK